MRRMTGAGDYMDPIVPKCTIFQRLQIIEAYKRLVFAVYHAKRLGDRFNGLALVGADAAECTSEQQPPRLAMRALDVCQ